MLKPHVPSDDRWFPGRLPSQLPGFGERLDEWIVDAIISHHGKGVRSKFELRWKAGDHTWAPYREVAHLIAMDCYCELMGVKDPQDLLAAYPKRESMPELSVSAVRVCGMGYKGRGHSERGGNPSTMTQSLTSEEWSECSNYAYHYQRCLLTGSSHPGPPPARYADYQRAVGMNSAPTPTPTPQSTPHFMHYYPPMYGQCQENFVF